MKKFFAFLFVLVIIAGLGFFFGWAQTGVPPDAYGIIRSKTHGIDTRLVKPGEFRWVWYKLIPTNVQTAVFRLNPVNHVFSAKNNLPSGEAYSAFAGMGGSFSWEINAAFSFCLRPEALVPLLTEHNIGTQEELARYENDMAGQIEAFIPRHIDLIEALLENGESPELEKKVQEQFPFIANFSIQVKSATVPDFALYRQAKGLYEDYTAIRKGYLSDELRDKVKDRVESYHRFDDLEQYGALLTKYPILLEYLKLEGNK